MFTEQQQDLENTQSLKPWSTPTLQRLSGADNTEKLPSPVETNYDEVGPS